MKRIINIPIYSTLSPKHRQIANLVIGGLVCVVVVLLVSGMLNGPEQVKGPAGIKGGPKPHPMSAQLPGENLDPKDVWIGGAQKDVARMHDDLRQGADRDRQRDEQQDRINKEVLATLKELKEAKPTPAMAVAATGPGQRRRGGLYGCSGRHRSAAKQAVCHVRGHVPSPTAHR